MTPDEFAATIKAKYPQYANVDNTTLAQSVVAKYPQYASQVNFQPTPVDNSEASATLPVTATDNPLSVGSIAKGVVNAPKDAFDFAKGLVSQPATILDDVSKIVSPNANPNAPAVSPLDVLKNLPEGAAQTFSSLIPDSLKHLFTNPAQSLRDVENAPVSNIVPTIGGLEGGAEALDSATGLGDAATAATARNAARTASDAANTVDIPGGTMEPSTPLETVPTTFSQSLNNGLSTIASPFTSLLRGASNTSGDALASVVQVLTGVDSDAVKNIFNNPEDYTQASKDANTRDALSSDLSDAINQRLSDLSSTGQGYNPIRQDTSTQVQMPENFIPTVLSKFGLSMDAGGKIIADSNSITRNPSDINALQNFVDNWKDKQTMTPNEFLNMRKDIGAISKFGKDIGSNRDAATVGKELYAQANATMRPQITGLKELDSVYGPEKQATVAMQKEFFKKDGTLKDGVPAKIANALKDGKAPVLQRLESIMPGVTKRIEILDTVEKINKAEKGGLLHTAVETGIGVPLAGVLPAVITAIITHPSVAVPIIRGLGLSAVEVGRVTDALTAIAKRTASNPVLASTAAASAVKKR